jgi:hypothetical protein
MAEALTGAAGRRAAHHDRRTHWWVLALLSGAMSCAAWVPGQVDLAYFAMIARRVVGGETYVAYETPWNQAGPFELAASLLALPQRHQQQIGYLWAGRVTMLPLHLVVGTGLMLLLLATVRAVRRSSGLPDSRLHEVIVGATALTMLMPARVWVGSHAAEVAIPFMWVWATALAARGRAVMAGILIGLSAGWESWGVLGAPILLLERRPHRLLIASAAAGLAAVAVYLPFAATGQFELFKLTWTIRPGTLPSLLWSRTARFTWQMRLVQGLSTGSAGALTVLAGRRSRNVVWLAPLVIILVRLLLDPLLLPYYWFPILLLTTIGLGLAPPLTAGTGSRTRTLAALALPYLAQFGYLGSYDGMAMSVWLPTLAVVCAVAIAVLGVPGELPTWLLPDAPVDGAKAADDKVDRAVRAIPRQLSAGRSVASSSASE